MVPTPYPDPRNAHAQHAAEGNLRIALSAAQGQANLAMGQEPSVSWAPWGSVRRDCNLLLFSLIGERKHPLGGTLGHVVIDNLCCYSLAVLSRNRSAS